MRILRVLLLVLCVTKLTGCASGSLREASGAFGTQTKRAVALQQSVLADYLAFKFIEAQEFYVRNKTVLTTSPACDLLATSSSDVDYIKTASQCSVVPKTKIGKRKGEPDLINPVYPTNLVALANALGGYAEALAILSADFKAENAALGRAVTAFGSQVLALDRALASVQERPGRINQKQTTAVAELIGAILNAQFQLMRDQKLVELIRRMDPVVQKSASILSESVFLARELHKTAVDKALLVAIRDQNRAAKNRGTPEKKLRQLNDNLYARTDDLKRVSAIQDPFKAVAKAHAALVAESKKPLGFNNYAVFIEHMLTIAEKSRALAQVAKR